MSQFAAPLFNYSLRELSQLIKNKTWQKQKSIIVLFVEMGSKAVKIFYSKIRTFLAAIFYSAKEYRSTQSIADSLMSKHSEEFIKSYQYNFVDVCTSQFEILDLRRTIFFYWPPTFNLIHLHWKIAKTNLTSFSFTEFAQTFSCHIAERWLSNCVFLTLMQTEYKYFRMNQFKLPFQIFYLILVARTVCLNHDRCAIQQSNVWCFLEFSIE